MASIKQAFYVRDQYPDSKPRYSQTSARRALQEVQPRRADENITFTKGKVAQASEDPATGDVTVTWKTLRWRQEARPDMLVLAQAWSPS
jgi:heterodisulfide reductase subunit A-like polyferredoxin